MQEVHTVVAAFNNHERAELAVKKLAAADFDIKSLSIVGRGYHKDENIFGFYNVGERVTLWGGRGAFWGALWGLFFGGLFVTLPVSGPVIVLGYLASAIATAIEGAVVVGGLSALGAALYSIGIPKDSVLKYETAISADKFLVMAHGSADEVRRARDILQTVSDVAAHDTQNSASSTGHAPKKQQTETMREIVERSPPISLFRSSDTGFRIVAPDVGHQPLGQTTKE